MKIGKVTVCVLALIMGLALKAGAFDVNEFEKQANVGNVIKSIPDEFSELLPEDAVDPESAVESANNADLSFAFSFAANVLKKIAPSVSKNFCSLLGIIVMISVINAAANKFGGSEASRFIELMSTSFLAVFLFDSMKNLIEWIELFVTSLDSCVKALIPVMTVVYSMGGNASAAVVNSSGLAAASVLTSALIRSVFLPLMKICLGLGVAGSIGKNKGIFQITKTAKGIFTALLSAAVTSLSFFLIFKTNLSASSDSFAARTVRFAGSFIPVVGSALGDSVRSVMAGVKLVKNSVGVVGLIAISAVCFPTVIYIAVNKVYIDISAGISSIMGCENESALLKEYSSILGFSIAVTVCVSLAFVFELIVFVSVSPALSGG